MDLYVYKKDYFRESQVIQGAINESMIDLYKRIVVYENQNIPFEKIFNDDKIKYDKNGDFYTFKTQKDRMQLRILYAYIKVNDVPTIIVVDYHMKKKNDKRYIRLFEAAKKWEPYELYALSQKVMTYQV